MAFNYHPEEFGKVDLVTPAIAKVNGVETQFLNPYAPNAVQQLQTGIFVTLLVLSDPEEQDIETALNARKVWSHNGATYASVPADILDGDIDLSANQGAHAAFANEVLKFTKNSVGMKQVRKSPDEPELPTQINPMAEPMTSYRGL